MEQPRDPHDLDARTPAGRRVVVRAVQRGQLLRDLSDGSGQVAGLLLEVALKVGTLALSQLHRGWTIGVVSRDEEPGAGHRVLHREKFPQADPSVRLEELKAQIETGDLPIPQPLNWRFRRKPPTS